MSTLYAILKILLLVCGIAAALAVLLAILALAAVAGLRLFDYVGVWLDEHPERTDHERKRKKG